MNVTPAQIKRARAALLVRGMAPDAAEQSVRDWLARHGATCEDMQAEVGPAPGTGGASVRVPIAREAGRQAGKTATEQAFMGTTSNFRTPEVTWESLGAFWDEMMDAKRERKT